MMKIPIKGWSIPAGCFVFLLFTLTACTILGSGERQSSPTAVPTSSILDMQVITPQACLVAEQGMISVEAPQGDLISWSPDADILVYIASTTASSWNVGELSLLSAPDFNSPQSLASGAAGELTWSPDGSKIAYLGLRRSDNLFTISLVSPRGDTLNDLFPAEDARTDDYSSQKSILEWLDENQLRVMVSCGLDCMQTIDISVVSGNSSLVGDPIQRTWGIWSAHTHHPVSIPEEFTSLPGQLNWSWDEQHIAYIDDRGNAWVINPGNGTLYPLDIGQFGTAIETDWSYDNHYLAVQVDRSLKIFSFNCP
jgi:hypothetical protein